MLFSSKPKSRSSRGRTGTLRQDLRSGTSPDSSTIIWSYTFPGVYDSDVFFPTNGNCLAVLKW
jgi:hypothetical protein